MYVTRNYLTFMASLYTADICKISKVADDKCNNLKDAQGNNLQMSLRYSCTDKGTIKGAFYNGTTCSGDSLQMDLGEFKDNDCQLGVSVCLLVYF